MYGMSAKDRMSLFEKKGSSSDVKKTSGGPKKIGKLNIASKKEAEKLPLNKPLAKKIGTKKEREEQIEGSSKLQEKKVEEKKPEEKKPVEKKPEEKKPEEKKPVEKKPVEKKPEEKKPEEKKPVEKKPEEKKPEEKKPVEKKPEEKKPVEKKPEEKKQTEKRPEEKTTLEKKPIEKKSLEKKPIEKKPDVKKVEEKKTEPNKIEDKKVQEKREEIKKPVVNKTGEDEKEAEKKLMEKKAEEKKLTEKKEEAKKSERMEKPTPKEPSKPEKPAEPLKAAEKIEEAKKPELKKPEPKKEEAKKPELKKPEPKTEEAKKPELKKPEDKEPAASEPKEDVTKVTPKVGQTANKGPEVRKSATLRPGVAVIDDLDLDSELEANLGVVSDIELQSPTVASAGPALVVGKAEVGIKEAKPTDVKTPAVQQAAELTEVKAPPPPQQAKTTIKGTVAIEEIPPTSLELKAKSAKDAAPASSTTMKVEALPQTELHLKAKPQTTKVQPAEAKIQAVKQPPPKTDGLVTTKPAPTKQEPPITAGKVPAEKKPEPSKPKEETAKPAPQSQVKPSGPAKAVEQKAAPKPAVKQNAEDREVSAILDAALKQEKPETKNVEVVVPKKESVMPKTEFKPLPDEFYNTIFYFSGMGTMVGSALAEGVYVAENTARISLDDEDVQNAKKDKMKAEADKEAVIKAARVQATDISVELKHLQNLLDSLPTFMDTDINAQQVARATDKAVRGSHFPPQKREPSSWVKRQPVSQQQQQQQQNAIPTWKQQVQDGMVMMGQQPSQRAHPGVQAQPFVPAGLKEKQAPGEGTKKPTVLPQPKIEPTPPEEQRLRSVEPVKIQQPGSNIHKETTTIGPPPTAVQDQIQPVSAAQAFVPPPPPPPPPQPSSKPPGGVPVLPVAAPLAPAGVPSDLHRPGAVRTEAAETKPPAEYLVKIAGKDREPTGERTREFGVHTPDARIPTQPWQQRYGKKKVDELPQPRPFGGVINPKGLKTWQLSRLRTLEAQGFDVKQPEDFDTYAHMKSQSEENLPSLAPYLVSGRSKEQDFRKLAGDGSPAGYQRPSPYVTPGPVPFNPVSSTSFQPMANFGFKPKSKSISTPTFRSVAAPYSVPKVYEPTINGTLPYCDL
ncbi:hypothetical protein LSH36_353g02023 [Paralvinella palmiformis]|uniref:Uncharacterized protein n=1 Tax=Paralvinella palmiformis TaxID=53620 RepID=A0AAD9JFK3_9ANNE|nr:hypothetical protein LSH36_353g02023 [Paralvinella palmiformis]